MRTLRTIGLALATLLTGTLFAVGAQATSMHHPKPAPVAKCHHHCKPKPVVRCHHHCKPKAVVVVHHHHPKPVVIAHHHHPKPKVHHHHHYVAPKPVVVVTPGRPCKCGTFKYYSAKHHGCLDARLK
jgi:hypothetical protein